MATARRCKHCCRDGRSGSDGSPRSRPPGITLRSTAALEASARADVAKERLARLDRGENVSGGLGKPLDLVAVLKAAGFTDREIQRCRDCALLGEIGAFEECSPLALMRQSEGLHERRISGSS
jgi:hypothetical protein